MLFEVFKNMVLIVSTSVGDAKATEELLVAVVHSLRVLHFIANSIEIKLKTNGKAVKAFIDSVEAVDDIASVVTIRVTMDAHKLKNVGNYFRRNILV